MPDSDNINDLFFGFNPIYDSTRFAKNLADLFVVKLGHDPARFRELGQPLQDLEYTLNKLSSSGGIIFGDVCGKVFEIEPSGGSPSQSVSHSANSSLTRS
jgi:hypothetical protein